MEHEVLLLTLHIPLPVPSPRPLVSRLHHHHLISEVPL